VNGFSDEVEIELLVRAGVPNVASLNSYQLFFGADAVYDFLKERSLDTTHPDYHVQALELVSHLSEADRAELRARIPK
jgi:hypothetical protein